MITYREGKPEDLEALVRFVDKNLTDYFMPASKVRTILTGESEGKRWSDIPSIVWLALDGTEIIGILFASNTGSLWNLVVHENYRNQGVGSKLVELSKVKKVRCKWDMSSGDPTKFYERLGFGKVGEPVCGQDGEFGRKTSRKSIQIMEKGGKIPSLKKYICEGD